MSIFKYLAILFMAAIGLSSCKKDHFEEHNEEEIITTLQVILTPQGGGTTLTYEFDDADGPGGNDPSIDDIRLAANTSYDVTVKFLNRSVSPAEDINEEIEEESEAHRIYYEPSTSSKITVSNLDLDASNGILGLNSTWTTGVVANGTITITLRHYAANPPNKQDADPVNSPKSSTDAVVTFTTIVQ